MDKGSNLMSARARWTCAGADEPFRAILRSPLAERGRDGDWLAEDLDVISRLTMTSAQFRIHQTNVPRHRATLSFIGRTSLQVNGTSGHTQHLKALDVHIAALQNYLLEGPASVDELIDAFIHTSFLVWDRSIPFDTYLTALTDGIAKGYNQEQLYQNVEQAKGAVSETKP